MAFQINATIGDYSQGPCVGKWTYGSIRMGRHNLTRKVVAIKSMDKFRIHDTENVNFDDIEFLRVSIRHPQILKLYDVLSTPTHIVMITELAETDLEKLMFCSPDGLPFSQARKFFQQIISGVDFCHRHYVIHKDLQLANMLLDSQMNIKITDFGISRLNAHGTPPFAAPEIQNKLASGPPLDIFSLGVILHCLLCGKFPVETDLKSTRQNALTGKMDVPLQIANIIQDLVSHMLRRDPARRATIDDIKRNEWFSSNLPEGFFLSPCDDAFFIKAEIVQLVLQALKKEDVPKTDLELDTWNIVQVLLDGQKDNTILARYNEFDVNVRIPRGRTAASDNVFRGIYIKSEDPQVLYDLLGPKNSDN